MVTVAGIDLAAYQHRPTGMAVVSGSEVLFIGVKHTDDEILSVIIGYRPVAVAIDSPLSHAETYRRVDIAMKMKGYPVLPPGWRTMKPLVSRALRLKESMEARGIVVIETHPRSALKSSGCKSVEELLDEMGVRRGYQKRLTRDEADALVAALVAYMYVRDASIRVSAPDGVVHLLPRLCG